MKGGNGVMTELYDSFCTYLKNKKTSENTVASYKRDVKSFIIFLMNNKIASIADVDSNLIEKYLAHLKTEGKSISTISRTLSSMRYFFKYLVNKRVVKFNPMISIKVESKKAEVLPEILSSSDINKLLNSPDIKTGKGKRDKAMLEIMYATGIRVSELLSLTIHDINVEVGYILINKSSSKERVIPLYPLAIECLNDYINNERPLLVRSNAATNVLFLNSNGFEMTRQGFWKIIKQYASDSGIAASITPKTLRHSFAAHLLENGADIHVIKDMLGHTALSSTKVYTKVLKNKYMSVYENCHPRAKQV